MDGTWTISELAEHAVAALVVGESVQVNGRVRDLPNARLIRWYTTIGLVDPPVGRRGRTALYGPRHLLQLVAIKKRQAAGRSIAEIQMELTGATNTTLERIAALPSSPTPSSPAPRPAKPRTPADALDDQPPDGLPGAPTFPQPQPQTRRTFKRAASPATSPDSSDAPATASRMNNARVAATGRPEGTTMDGAAGPPAASDRAAATTAEGLPVRTTAGRTDADAEDGPPGTVPEAPTHARFWSARPEVPVRPDVSYGRADAFVDYTEPDPAAIVQGVRLAPDLTLLLDVPTLSGDDLAAIQAAAAPLLGELRRRGLAAPAQDPAFLPADPSRRSP